jgi:hypothetical protein
MKIRHLLKCSGTTWLSFWVGTLLFDFIAYLVPFSIFIGVSVGFEILVVSQNFDRLMIIMVCFGVIIKLKYKDEFFAFYVCMWIDVQKSLESF